MANIKSAKKRAQQAEVRRQRNVAMRSRVRTKIKRPLCKLSMVIKCLIIEKNLGL